jgi:hypothetical protein
MRGAVTAVTNRLPACWQDAWERRLPRRSLPEHGNAAFPGGLYAGKDAGDPNGITYNLPEHGNAAFPGGHCRSTGTPPSQTVIAGARERRLPRRPVCRQGCRRSHAGDPNGITYNLPEHGNAAFPDGLYAGKDAGDPMPAIPCRRSQRHYIQIAGARERRLPRQPVCRQGCRRSHAGDPNGITYN